MKRQFIKMNGWKWEFDYDVFMEVFDDAIRRSNLELIDMQSKSKNKASTEVIELMDIFLKYHRPEEEPKKKPAIPKKYRLNEKVTKTRSQKKRKVIRVENGQTYDKEFLAKLEDRIRREAKNFDVVVVTTTSKRNDSTAKLCREMGIRVVRIKERHTRRYDLGFIKNTILFNADMLILGVFRNEDDSLVNQKTGKSDWKHPYYRFHLNKLFNAFEQQRTLILMF